MTWGLRNENCFEAMMNMADGAADVTITDPPYSEGTQTRSRAASSLADYRESTATSVRVREFGFEHFTPDDVARLLPELARVTKRWILVFSDDILIPYYQQPPQGLEYVRMCIYRKTNPPPQFSGDRPGLACEFIHVYHKPGKKRWNGGGRSNVFEHTSPMNRDGKTPRLHTAQKPVSLMAELVTLFSDEGETVADFFAGSCTTGVACLDTGRNFLGCELDPDYYTAAQKRLEAAAQRQRLFDHA